MSIDVGGRLAAFGLIMAAAAGCGGSSSGGAAAQSTPSAVSSSPAEKTSAAPAAAPHDSLTGIGASDDAWNAHHTEDPKYDAGAAYDPGAVDGEDRYYAVMHGDGRVYGFSERFPAHTRQALALQTLMQDMPADTRVLWHARLDTCAMYQFTSRTLATAAGADHGGVSVEFNSDEVDGGTPYFSPSNISEAIVFQVYNATADESSGC